MHISKDTVMTREMAKKIVDHAMENGDDEHDTYLEEALAFLHINVEDFQRYIKTATPEGDGTEDRLILLSPFDAFFIGEDMHAHPTCPDEMHPLFV